ncbi:MAG: DNA gyrase C-terminal beta-propeller domain-containing protein, partial [Stenotrophomonas maltophilia]
GGTLVRTRGSEISRVGRNTQGVTLIRLSKDEKLQAVERMDASIDDEELVVDAVPPVEGSAGIAPVAADETPQA